MPDSSLWQWVTAPPLWGSSLLRCTLLLGLAWLAHAALTRCGPECRRALWRAAAVGLILLPLATRLCPPLTVADVSVHAAAAAATAVTGETARLQTTAVAISGGGVLLARGLVLVWALGALMLLGRFALGIRRVAGLVRRSAAPPDWLRERCETSRVRVRCGTAARLRVTRDLNLPVLAGIARPTILIPAEMCDDGDPRVLDAALLHELRHVASRDVAWGWLLHVLRALLWFHPLAWSIPAAHSMACELSCDRMAAPAVGGARVYGSILAGMALEACRATRTCAPHMAGRSEVGRRLAALKGPLPSPFASRCFLVARWVMLPATLLLVASIAVGVAPEADDTGGYATAPEEFEPPVGMAGLSPPEPTRPSRQSGATRGAGPAEPGFSPWEGALDDLFALEDYRYVPAGERVGVRPVSPPVTRQARPPMPSARYVQPALREPLLQSVLDETLTATGLARETIGSEVMITPDWDLWAQGRTLRDP
jgi:beta-lactamase regulating signal transducer with metallopeptidase domain